MPNEHPWLWLISGPNGVGKTSYATGHIRAVTGDVRFINLDDIARGLSPFDPTREHERATRVALRLIRDNIVAGYTFTIETTLAGRTHMRTMATAKRAGFRIALLFFTVPKVETCLARIARRVSEGGHDVPEADARRRYARAHANLPAYAAEADLWRVFDNSGQHPATMAEGRHGCLAWRSERVAPLLDSWLLSLPRCPEGE